MKQFKVKTLKGHGFDIELDPSAFFDIPAPKALTDKERLEKAEQDAKLEDEIMFHSSN